MITTSAFDARRTLGALAAAVLVAACLAAPRAQAEEAVVGPAVGSDISATIEAVDQTGATRDLASLAGGEGLVVFFVRSLDWCPYCKAQGIEVEAAFDDFYARGYGITIVSTDDAGFLARYAAREDVRTTLLADPDSAIITALDLKDPAFDGTRRDGLPYPATLILGPDGVVRDVLFREDVYGEDKAYRERVATSDVIATLDGDS